MTENEWFKKYGEFLEEMCERVMADRPVAIAVSYTTENGAVGTGYFECTMANKLTMAGMMLNDAVVDGIKNNPEWFRRQLEEEPDD